MKTLVEFMKKTKISSIVWISFIFYCLSRICSKLLVKSIQVFADTLANNEPNKYKIILVILVLEVLLILLYHISHYVKSRREVCIKQTLDEYHKHVMRIPYNRLVDLDQSKILNSISGVEPGIDTLVNLTQPLSMIIAQPVIILILIWGINKYLTLVMAVVTVVSIVVIYNANKELKVISKDRKQLKGKYYSCLNRLKYFTTIKNFSKENFESKIFQDTTENLKVSGLKRKKCIREMVDVILVCYALEELTVIFFALYCVPKGIMSVSEVLLAFTLADDLLSPFESLSDIVDTIQSTKTDVEFYNEIMNIPEEDDGQIELNEFSSNIKFKNVSFEYSDSKTVLKNINISINKGDKIGIYGPSGGGKSSLISLINRINHVTKGKILIDGIDINKISSTSLRRTIGVVSQSVELFADSTIRENIAYGINATDSEIVEAAKKANCHEFISRLKNGYDSIVGDNGIKLSGGESQRITLARLFLLNPPIIVLDESTSKLDNESEKVVQDAIDKLSDNRTVIAIAHRLSTIKDFDRLIGIDCHTIIEEGNNNSLMSKEDSMWYKLNK